MVLQHSASVALDFWWSNFRLNRRHWGIRNFREVFAISNRFVLSTAVISHSYRYFGVVLSTSNNLNWDSFDLASVFSFLNRLVCFLFLLEDIRQQFFLSLLICLSFEQILISNFFGGAVVLIMHFLPVGSSTTGASALRPSGPWKSFSLDLLSTDI